ncbi:MAG TPA: GT-D fold domain-containing glycosyltransferase [Catenuloplanes sp.]|jgi:hypothetical protein
MQEVLRGIRSELQQQRQQQRQQQQQQQQYLEVFRLAATREVFQEVGQFTAARQLSFERTLERITDERLSFARFGDGELRIMLHPEFVLRFQRWSPGLAGDLRSVLTLDGFDPERLLLGFPFPYRSLYWSDVWLDIWPELKPLLGTSVEYGNTHVSRPIFFQQLGQRGVQLWRKVWEGQDACVVTGEGSRFWLAPELFDNLGSTRYVHSTPVDAYDDLPRLMEVLAAEDPNQLYLVALGPAGTLVTAWLARMGRWAIDVGHISNSWANVFAGAKRPEALELRRS